MSAPRIYPVDGHYDIDISSSGSGWMGTFRSIVQKTIEDITLEGPWSPCEVTYDDGKTVAGTLHGYGFGDDTIRIEGLLIELDRITRFRA